MKKSYAAYGMFSVLLLSYVLNSVDRNAFSILTVEVRNQMSLSLPQIGLAATVFTLGMGLAALPSGRLLRFMSHKNVVLLGLFIFSAATFLTAYSRALPDLLAYRFVSGLGEAMQVTALIAIGTSYFYRRRALVTGLISFAYGIGAVIAPLATAALLKAYDWKMPFIVFGLVGIVMLILVSLGIGPWFSESKAIEERANSDPVANPGASDTIWNSASILLGIASLCNGVAVYGTFGLYPLYLRTVIGFSPLQVGTVMSFVGIGGFLAPAGGWLGDRFGYDKILYIALLIVALSGGLPFTGVLGKSINVYAIFAFFFGLSVVGLFYANMSAIIIESMSPAKTGIASGLFVSTYYIPAAFAGLLLGWLKEVSNWTTAGLLQTSGFAILSLVFIVIARMRRRRIMSPAMSVRG